MTDAQSLAFVRAVHTAIYVVMSASVFCVLYAGLTGARGAWVWGALAMVGFEVVVFAGSGMRCPLTAIAAKYGSAPGEDTFFPEPMTRYTLSFFGPLLGLGFLLLVAAGGARLAEDVLPAGYLTSRRLKTAPFDHPAR